MSDDNYDKSNKATPSWYLTAFQCLKLLHMTHSNTQDDVRKWNYSQFTEKAVYFAMCGSFPTPTNNAQDTDWASFNLILTLFAQK